MAGSTDSRGVIFYSTGDPEHNTTAPGGAFSNSGWNLVGTWTGFQAVPIGPNHFIAARHIGGAIGEIFTLNGANYTTTAFFDDASSDLRIWQVSENFPSWAPLYRPTNEVSKPLVVFGRGVTRGSEIFANSNLRGWHWAASDGRLRWGTNTIASVVNGGSYWGELLYSTFDAAGGGEEVHLGTGDSSGPIFIHDGAKWALAGVAATVDAYFNTTNSGSGFTAAIFDARGLYYSSNPPTSPWQLVGGPAPVPSGFYATRISSRAAWIDSIVPPTADVPLFAGVHGAILAASFLITAGRILKTRRRLTSSVNPRGTFGF